MATTVTANAEPIEIEAEVDKRFSSIVVNLPVQQTGTGTPSPTNPRPFTVWTDVSLYVSDTEEADEPTLSIELPTPLYGGKIDMVRGEIATTYNSKESGTGWEMTEEGQFRCQVSAYNNGDETSTNVADLYAVHYETVSNKDAYDATDDLTCGLATIDGTTYLYVNDAQYTTLETFATHIADEVFVFRAHIPMSDVTEPHIVYLPEGTSYVWADAGFVDYTVSGTPPLSLPNSLGKPLKAWEVEVLPKQDLHGYENPWPAGGGANKWDEEWEAGRYNPTTGEPTTGESGIRSKNFIPVDPSKTYYLYCGTTITNDFRILFFDANKNFIIASAWTNQDTVLSFAGTTADTAYIKFYIAGGVYGNVYKNDVAINNPATVTTYSPNANICPIYGTDKLNLFVEESYDPSATPTASITLPSTVYTATIGIEGGESRSAEVDLGDLSYSPTAQVSNYHGFVTNDIAIKPPASGNEKINAICTGLKPLSYNESWTPNSIAPHVTTSNLLRVILPTTINTAAECKAYVTGMKLVYLTENSTEFAVPSATIPTPKGTASTWATAEDGTVDSMEVTYVGKA